MTRKFLVAATVLLLAACSSNPSRTSAGADGFITAQGEFYCEGMVAADGPGCMIKIDGVAYKMQRENNELYEENAIYDKAGKPVKMEVVYKKTGQKFKMMGGNEGPEIITIKSVKMLE